MPSVQDIMRQIDLSALLMSVRNRSIGTLSLLLRSDNVAIDAARAAACMFAASRLRKRKTSWAARAATALEEEAKKFFRGNHTRDVVVTEDPNENVEAGETTVVDSPTYPGYCVVRPRKK